MTDPSFVADLHRMEFLFLSGIVVLTGLLAAGIAAVANRKWPERSLYQIATFTALLLGALFLVLTIALIFWLMSEPCAENLPCDAGAMAAAGAAVLGAIEVVTAVVVGAPVAFFTARAIRRR